MSSQLQDCSWSGSLGFQSEIVCPSWRQRGIVQQSKNTLRMKTENENIVRDWKVLPLFTVYSRADRSGAILSDASNLVSSGRGVFLPTGTCGTLFFSCSSFKRQICSQKTSLHNFPWNDAICHLGEKIEKNNNKKKTMAFTAMLILHCLGQWNSVWPWSSILRGSICREAQNRSPFVTLSEMLLSEAG